MPKSHLPQRPPMRKKSVSYPTQATPATSRPNRPKQEGGYKPRSDASPSANTSERGSGQFVARGERVERGARSERSESSATRSKLGPGARPKGQWENRGERAEGFERRATRSASPDRPAFAEKDKSSHDRIERGERSKPLSLRPTQDQERHAPRPKGQWENRGERAENFDRRPKRDAAANRFGSAENTPSRAPFRRGEEENRFTSVRPVRQEKDASETSSFKEKTFHSRSEPVSEHGTHDKAPAQPERLQKVLAQTGLGARREIEEWIAAGRVEVNGKIAELGQKVVPGDRIKVGGKLVYTRFAAEVPRVLLYHKPEGEIVSRQDPEGRPTVFERLPIVRKGRWIAIGRLDYNTSGLLMFTNDGTLANNLMHPRYEIEREYAVRILGELTPELIEQLKTGIELEDGMAHFNTVFEAGGEGVNKWYHVTLNEGRNREVRRLFEAIGLTVSRLMRVRYGSISLPTRLKRGMWMELPGEEVCKLIGIPVPPSVREKTQRERAQGKKAPTVHSTRPLDQS